MPSFSERSKDRLSTCEPKLQELFNAVVGQFDCTILEGHRGQERQDRLYDERRSQLRYPNGRHNKLPSQAVDVAPYPVDWQNIRRFYLFAGYVLGIAEGMGISIRWGGDWDMDTEITDQTFNDLVHFEVYE